RFINYMTPFMIVYFAEFVSTIYRRQLFYRFTGIAIFLIVFSFTTLKINYYAADTSRFAPGTRKYNLYVPYYSIFNKKEYSFREAIFFDAFQERSNKN